MFLFGDILTILFTITLTFCCQIFVLENISVLSEFWFSLYPYLKFIVFMQNNVICGHNLIRLKRAWGSFEVSSFRQVKILQFCEESSSRSAYTAITLINFWLMHFLFHLLKSCGKNVEQFAFRKWIFGWLGYLILLNIILLSVALVVDA